MKYANEVPKLTAESNSHSFNNSANRKKGASPTKELVGSMTNKEKRFYLPYLTNNQKRTAKSPPSVTFSKQSSRDQMLLKSTDMWIETPVKSYNGKPQRYVASHTITKTVPRCDEELSDIDDKNQLLDTTVKSNYFFDKQPLQIPSIKNPRSTSIDTKIAD